LKKFSIIVIAVSIFSINVATAYYLRINNKTNINYSWMIVTFIPVGFNASCDKFERQLIPSNESIIVNVGSSYMDIPIVGALTAQQLNFLQLNVWVMAKSELQETFLQIVRTKHKIKFSEGVSNKIIEDWEVLQNLNFPEITVTINGLKDSDIVIEVGEVY